jgi:hypothetical protein
VRVNLKVSQTPFIYLRVVKSLVVLGNVAMTVSMLGGLSMTALAGGPSGAAKEGVEIVPVAVWLGEFGRPSEVNVLKEIRATFPGMRFAHAVDGAPMLRDDASQNSFRSQLAQVLEPGDDILLHAAPWKSLAKKSGVAFKFQPTAFGAPIVPEDCVIDCGLDLSFSAFTKSESTAILSSSRKALGDAGFGQPKAIYFDEGIVTQETRAAAKDAGLIEDWSGVELSQLSDVIGRLPIYRRNEKNLSAIPWRNQKEVSNGGLNLDHVRFGIQSEIGNLESAAKLIKTALKVAKAESRVVRIPIVFNVEDLMHTRGFVKASLREANRLAAEMGVPVVNWVTLNGAWDVKKIGTNAIAKSSPPPNSKSNQPSNQLPTVMGGSSSPAAPVEEAEFVPDASSPDGAVTSH